MPDVKVRNTLPRPLYINLPSGRGRKIPARGTVELKDSDLNAAEVLFHLRRGDIVLLAGAEAAPPAAPAPLTAPRADVLRDAELAEGGR